MPLWGDKDAKSATGGVAIAANGLVTGTNTLLDTEAKVGDYIVVGNKKHLIQSITSNTVAHVADAGVLGGTIGAVANAAYSLQESPKYISASHVADNANNVYGINAAELGASGAVIAFEVTFVGSGYSANAAVTVSGGGGTGAQANAQANSIGKIAQLNIVAAGSSFESKPTVTIAAPAGATTNAGAVAANGFIPIASNVFQVDDYVTYDVAASNTALAELTDGANYYVQAANTTGIYLSETVGGTAITLTAGDNEEGHTFTGQTATAEAVISGGVHAGVAHTGWVKRTVGTGNKAGRVFTEVLVAGGISSDAGDDTEFPDS